MSQQLEKFEHVVSLPKKRSRPGDDYQQKLIPRTESIKRTLEILNMYLNTIQLFKARTYLQYDLHKTKSVGNPMGLPRRDRRITWIKDIISEHWYMIGEKFTKWEHSAIFKYWAQNFEIERFKIT